MPYDDIQAAIDMGKGFAAEQLGVPYNVYRLNGSSNGDFIQSSNLFQSNVSVLARVGYGEGLKKSLETERQQGILWYTLIADMTNFRVGDVFVLDDPIYGAGYSSVSFSTLQFKAFALADRSPIKQTIAGRLDINAQFSRLNNQTVDSKLRLNSTSAGSIPFIIQNGVAQLGTVGQTASFIPVGLIAAGRTYGDREFYNNPGDQRRSGWQAYVPPIQGLEFRAGDKMITEDGSRYTILVPYGQEVGASGSQIFLEREVSQAG